MDDRESLPADEVTPDGFDLARIKAMMEERADTGWVWDAVAQTLAHPDDRQLYFRIDPLTRRLTLSAALARQLAQEPGPDSPEERP